MNISLGPEFERLIAEKIRSGRYRSADEVVRQGLVLLQAKDTETQPVAVNSEPLADIFARIASEVPDSEWAQVPADLSKNVDHYLYGTEKTS
ncbi:MAG: type II toxin-antitoxin system ParD family antitoxin [Candidatus Acidiferrales bacterium]